MSHDRRSEPNRTCIGCRRRSRQSDMLRVVVRGTQVLPDHRVRQTGRGAYLHREEACIVAAVQRQAFARAFRTRLQLSIEPVLRVLQPSGERSNQEFGSQSGDEMSTQ